MILPYWCLPNDSHDKQLLSYKHQLAGLHNEGCCGAETELVHRAAPRSNPGQFMWDVWWAKWHWVRFFPNTLVFPCQYHFTKHSPVSNISPMLHTHHFNATFIRRISGRKLGTFKANLFLIGEHWPETYLNDDFPFSEALRGNMGCEIQQDLGLHRLLLLLALILWVRQRMYFNHTRIHKENG